MLLTFTISPIVVDVSSGPATLNVHVVAGDDLSGFGSGSTGNGSIDIRNTSGGNPFGIGSLPMTGGTPLNPTFDFTLTVPQFVTPGAYPINLTLIDNAFNTARFAPADLQRLGFPSSITVTSVADTTPPHLVTFSVNPTAVDVSSRPATLNIHVVASDDLSGFGSGSTGNGSIDIRNTSGGNPFGIGSLPMTGGTQLNPTFDFTLTVPQFVTPGAYPINLTLIDNAFNTARFAPADLQRLGLPSSITVTSVADTTPPHLVAFSVNPTAVDVSSGPATVNVHIAAGDDLSGFGSGSTGNGSIDIRNTSGGNPFGIGSLPITGGTPLNPTFDFTLTVPQFVTLGAYPINLTLIDNAFNTARFAPADLQRLGFPSAVTVWSSGTKPIPQTITFVPLPDVIYGMTPFDILASSSSKLPVNFTAMPASVCAVAGTKVTIVGAGSCTVTTFQAGNATYAAATPVTQTFTVNKASQVITFPLVGDVSVPAAAFNVNASSSSGLPLTLASNATAVCTLSGTSLTLIATGTCSITATQPGSSSFLAAAPVTRSFNVITNSSSGELPVIAQAGVGPIYSSSAVIQPGSWISIYGKNLASTSAVWDGAFPTSLSGVTVAINGKPAYLWYVSPTQINAQAPDDVTIGPVEVVVATSNGTATSTVTLAQASPSLCRFDDGKHIAGVIMTPDGRGAYAHGAYDLVGPNGAFAFSTRAVKVGEQLLLYGVGFGPTNPSVSAGQPFSGAASTVYPVVITIGGVRADVAFSGLTEAGLYQFNVTVPSVSNGDQMVQATVNGIQTQPGALVTVQ